MLSRVAVPQKICARCALSFNRGRFLAQCFFFWLWLEKTRLAQEEKKGAAVDTTRCKRVISNAG